MKKTFCIIVVVVMTLGVLSSCLTLVAEETRRSDDSSDRRTRTEASQDTVDLTDQVDESEGEAHSVEEIMLSDEDMLIHLGNALYFTVTAQTILVDEDVSNGLTIQEDGPMVCMEAGTVLRQLDYYLPSGERLYLLQDGRCIRFMEEVFSDGETYIDPGISGYYLVSEFFGPEGWYERELPVHDVNIIEEYELPLNTPALSDPNTQIKNMVIYVDWNGNGVEDTIYRELPDPAHPYSNQTVTFTDGLTGEVTDITDQLCIASEYPPFFGTHFLSNNVVLYHDTESDTHYLIDYYFISGNMYESVVYFYDSDHVVGSNVTKGSFTFDGDQFSIIENNYFFGSIFESEHFAQILNNRLEYDEDAEVQWQDQNTDAFPLEEGQERVWFIGVRSAIDESKRFLPLFTFNHDDFDVELVEDDEYSDITLESGSAIFPMYFEEDIDSGENTLGEGYLYFEIDYGRTCRMRYTISEYGDVYFNGKTQGHVFACLFGG